MVKVVDLRVSQRSLCTALFSYGSYGQFNAEYEDYIFLDDHRDADTYIKDVKTGNGRYNLILCQSKAKLRRFREMLSKTDYYDYWDKSYLETILGEDLDVICQSTLG